MPAAEAPAVAVVEAPPPAPPPAPQVELHVDGTGAIDKGPPPAAPKKGSAMDRLRQDLQKKANVTPEPEPAKPAAEKPAAKPEGETPPAEGTPPPAEAAAAAEKGKKVSPWKLVEEYKAKLAEREKEILEAKKNLIDPKEKEEWTARLSAAEKRRQELEEEMRFVDFSKSQEFKTKYQQPYEEAWKKAMADLGELTLADPATNAERPVTPQDILELVNLPLKEARAKAVEQYGDFADDVMAHRKEIRNLFEAQNKALEEARKAGAERDAQRQQQFKEYHEKVSKEVGATWKELNDALLKDEKYAKYFKPVEGDEEGNKRLVHGYTLADKAFSGRDPRDPRLTPEERKEIIQIHAAVRNRAAAFGRTMYQLQQAEAKIAALTAEIAKYRGAEPGKGEGAREAAPTQGSTAHAAVFGALRKMAH